MNSPLKIGLIAALISALIVAGLVVSWRHKENDFYQFCTTKAYGWPTPWKIEYCDCEKSAIEYPKYSGIINSSFVLGAGVVGFLLFGAVALQGRKP